MYCRGQSLNYARNECERSDDFGRTQSGFDGTERSVGFVARKYAPPSLEVMGRNVDGPGGYSNLRSSHTSFTR